MKPLVKLSLYAAALGLLALVFSLYGRSDFLMTLANQLWSCF
jgi:hypothetical protein